MSRKILRSENGLTFIELLVSLAIFSLLTALVIGYLINSMNNFKRVNEEIALHDEANYVMSQIVNYIFVAKDVKTISNTETNPLIEVTSFEGSKKIIGFACNRAVVATDYGDFEDYPITGLDCDHNKFNGIAFLPITNKHIYFISSGSDSSEITLDEANDTVKIKIVLKNEQSKYGKTLVLDSEVSFVHVE